MNEHINDLDVARFRAGQLDRAEVETIGAHVRGCSQCASRIWGSREVRDSVEAIARNASSDATSWRWVAAAAILVLIGMLASYGLWRSRQNKMPVPVVIHHRPATQPQKHPWDAVVAEALRRGDLEPPPAVVELRRGADEIVRGAPGASRGIHLLAPVGQSVESQTPPFLWTVARGTFEVTVVRDGEVVARSGPIATTHWVPASPLSRGVVYEWQVFAEQGGRRFRIPPPEARAARFRVISDEEARMLAAARQTGDPLAVGVVAAQAGVIDEALTQLSAAPDPRARALAEKIRRW